MNASPQVQEPPDLVRVASGLSVASCACNGGSLWIRLHDAAGRVFAVAIVPRQHLGPVCDSIRMEATTIEAGHGGSCGHG